MWVTAWVEAIARGAIRRVIVATALAARPPSVRGVTHTNDDLSRLTIWLGAPIPPGKTVEEHSCLLARTGVLVWFQRERFGGRSVKESL